MNSIIEQIHTEFSEAEELLIKDVNAILNRAQTANKENISALSGLGFSNFRELREVSPEEIQKVTDLKKLVTNYQLLSPMYKFITEEKVISICKKYGLVHAPVALYNDSIPNKNQQEILSFNEWFVGKPEFLPTESLNLSHTNTWNGNDIQNMTTNHILNTINWISNNWTGGMSGRRESIMSSMNGSYYDDEGNFHFREEFQQKFGTLHADFLRELYKRGHINKEGLLAYMDRKSHVPYIPFHYDTLKFNFDSNITYRVTETINLGYLNKTALIDPLGGRFVALEWGVECFLKELQPKAEYSIVAAEHMVNMQGMFINDNYKVVPLTQDVTVPELKFFKDDDPIVLMKVDKGYLIVTAWGDEASDEDVLNQNLN